MLPLRTIGLRSAFSLMEVVIVMLLMAILSAVAAPAFIDSLAFHRVETAARRVKADLELARQTAKLKSATQTVTFSGPAYTMSSGVVDLDAPVTAYAVDLALAPYKMNNVVANFGGVPTASFNGFGTPTSGGAVVLTTPRHQCTVTLNAATGLVTITRNSADGLSPIDD
jgi:prepilin-type N-terminal cleavage/methylation domain-containing protein